MKRIIYAFLSVAFLCATPSLSSVPKEPIANYQVLFSPKDHIADQLITLIGKEKKSIKAAVYCLMHRGIADALIDAHNRGVKVEVIVDPFSLKSPHAPVKKMEAANIAVYIWNPEAAITKTGKKTIRRKPLMHDKFCILGNSKVWTGSFNFTFEASNSNQENVIILQSPELAATYLEEFKRLKKVGCMSLAKYLEERQKSKKPS
jgi:phosphatidylserine/phosphatidylglycerophosphate/cardiolipin synthase-like enzyme